jgi:hypothetical protein
MQSLKTDIISGVAISAVSLTMAIAWGRPFVTPPAAHAEDAPAQVQRQQPQVQPAPAQTQQTQTSKEKPHPGAVSQTSQR